MAKEDDKQAPMEAEEATAVGVALGLARHAVDVITEMFPGAVVLIMLPSGGGTPQAVVAAATSVPTRDPAAPPDEAERVAEDTVFRQLLDVAPRAVGAWSDGETAKLAGPAPGESIH